MPCSARAGGAPPRRRAAVARRFGRPPLGAALRSRARVEGGDRGLPCWGGYRPERSRARVGWPARCRLRRRAAPGLASAARPAPRWNAAGPYLPLRRTPHRAGPPPELAAAGAKPRRDAITGRDALTASEFARGTTRRRGSPTAIAQALFITGRTAKVHLNRSASSRSPAATSLPTRPPAPWTIHRATGRRRGNFPEPAPKSLNPRANAPPPAGRDSLPWRSPTQHSA
jgi:hypothetical protein